MRLLHGVLAALLAATVPAAAAQQANNLSLSDAISQMPPCASSATPAVVPSTRPASAGPTITRLNRPRRPASSTPARSPRHFVSTPPPRARNLTALSCDAPVRDKTARYNVMAIVLGVLTNLLVAVRLLYKQFLSARRALTWDDHAILVAALLGVAATVINVRGLTAAGMGRDVWTLTPQQLDRFGAFFYAMEVIYLAEITCVKLSLSAFYLYVFPGERARTLLWGTVVFNVASGVAFVVAGIFQCTPVSFFWKRYTDVEARGRCIDINAFGWAHAAIGIAVDVWLIAIPLSQLRKLQLHWKKKVGVTLMFLLGTFVTVVSILRLQSLIYLARSYNPTWDQWLVAWWSTIEVHVGIICASLPTLRLVLVRMCPRVFSTHITRNKSAPERSTRPNSASYIMQTTPPPKSYSSPRSPRPFVPPKDW
ncbi:Extracellular membrane protein, 8-cysteine region, CFEM [Cordyceps fumosorosea ARSEF 2679]|uniref:Extracellular membrane protein, 8-cysteine region, CFEM n=1 Tax=Cordyceps fumosorosea (strain ARSEF 2679) TaxID=1081104 RepID=A0A167R139_CORFA|nr:Extracellular membrane protein, 8-cysteine region, CFEM [Cordyceps fumosorosea ARSEF 2679]OAA58172.1 Extracellular membrane protein, 8-cysteine region, CFEM [Cordyceps fumosorosea ARSEF 2679]